jgi:hypothetical protein
VLASIRRTCRPACSHEAKGAPASWKTASYEEAIRWPLCQTVLRVASRHTTTTLTCQRYSIIEGTCRHCASHDDDDDDDDTRRGDSGRAHQVLGAISRNQAILSQSLCQITSRSTHLMSALLHSYTLALLHPCTPAPLHSCTSPSTKSPELHPRTSSRSSPVPRLFSIARPLNTKAAGAIRRSHFCAKWRSFVLCRCDSIDLEGLTSFRGARSEVNMFRPSPVGGLPTRCPPRSHTPPSEAWGSLCSLVDDHFLFTWEIA